MIYEVIKRDGSKVMYDVEKISNAIAGAFSDFDKEFDDVYVLDLIEEKLDELYAGYATVEDIQDIVEDVLIECGYVDEAKEYIRYRYRKELLRQSNTTDKAIKELLNGESEYWNTENSNKNVNLVTTQRDYIAGITSKDIARRFIFPKRVIEAHDAGAIHIHDMDYMAQNTLHNCCLINLNDMLQNGTVLNGVMIEKPHRLITAMTIATQIVSAVASSQYGGCTFSFSHLAPFVRESYNRYYNKYAESGLSIDKCEELTRKDINKEVADAIQTMNYQLNSFTTTNGQSPFVSVCIYLNENPEYKDEIAMLAAETFKQRIEGMKNRKGIPVTQAFPKLLYILDDNNCKEGTDFWWLTELAAKCTAKRMVPDYVSEKVMVENKGGCWPSMGCRSSLTPDRVTEKYGNIAKAKDYTGGPKYYGRFNIGVSTLNLPYIALEAQEEGKDFYEVLDKYLDMCHTVQRIRAERLSRTKAKVAPILWCDGALARLDPEETLEPLIHHGYCTSSIGYVGLFETIKVLIGESNTTPAGIEKSLEILQYLNDKMAKWKSEEDIDYSIYGTPIESTTYKFALALQRRFGIIPEISDKDYVMNSYHVDVKEHIDPFRKLAIEAKFQKLSPGGYISYIETSDLTHNIPAVLEVIKFIYETIGYAELNIKSDYCQECGYDGEIKIETDRQGKHYYRCPNCGNTNSDKMNIARRVCGYISTTVPNQGRLDEFLNRYVHLDDHEMEVA